MSQCDDSGLYSRKHSVVLLSSRYSTPGFEPEIHSTHLMLTVFASSFRILVTFAIVLEVRGTSFFQLHEPFLAGVLLNQKVTTRVLLMSSPFYIVTLPVQPFCIGYPEETC